MASHSASIAERPPSHRVVPRQASVPGWGAPVRSETKDAHPAAAPRTAEPGKDALDLAAAEDRVLVAAFLAGSQDAFAVIVNRHQRAVYQVCYRFVRNHEDAADLAQDVFVRAFKGLSHFKGDSALGTWLYRVGVNCCLNRLAAKRPPTEAIDASQHVDQKRDDPLRSVLRTEKAEHVRQAIAQLPPKQRATLLLRVYQDLSHEEIAAILGSSVGATKANFFHALGNLKRLLQS
jgi:RNA polymerase sigma-70 factor (ECF subfamily)